MKETDCHHGPTAGRYDRARMLTWLKWMRCPGLRRYWRPDDGLEHVRWD